MRSETSIRLQDECSSLLLTAWLVHMITCWVAKRRGQQGKGTRMGNSQGPQVEVQAVGFILKMMFSYRKPLLMLLSKDGMQGGSERW